MPRFSLDFSGVTVRAQDVMLRRMTTAALAVQRRTKETLNVGGTKQFPSMEGDPPHKVSTRLFQSINIRVFKTGWDSIVAIIGTKVRYARRLELGFVGTDSAGRNVQQGPRPFLRPAFRESEDDIKRAIGSTTVGGSV